MKFESLQQYFRSNPLRINKNRWKSADDSIRSGLTSNLSELLPKVHPEFNSEVETWIEEIQ